ncbi:MAG: group II intron maturase-specific domain-containing protein, partial [Terriglobales bacterium]
LVEQFLQERGLELSPAKTVITHVEKGFDFLGQNVRKYPNGKLLIKPSKKNVKTLLGGIRTTIKAALGMSAADLIRKLNPKIRGWANYHRHVVSTRTFARVDHEIFSSLWRWALRRHPNKNIRWCKQKYFALRRGREWSFFGETCDDEGSPVKFGCATPVAHPSGDTLKSKVTRTPMTLRMKFTSNNAKEPICRKRFGVLVRFAFSGMNNTGSALCAIQKSLGSRVGACTTAFPVYWVVRKAPRTAFYFIQSAMTGFIASEFLSRNRVSPKEAFEGLELCERKLSCTVLRGLDGSNPVRLLG